MSVIDILFRLDDISKKYEKYDVEKQRSLNSSSDDAFARLYSSFESQIDATLRKSELAAVETNRATVVALNAEVRRTKARLMDEVPKLQKLAQKKLREFLETDIFDDDLRCRQVKNLTRDEMEARTDLVLALPERIQAIPDGSRDGNFDNDFFEQSEESNQFRQEYEMRKMKQACLDIISEGLDTLKNLAKDMNEELDRQVPLIDEIDTKVDTASSDLRRNNVRLKETLTKVRSSQNFCVDIILVCILLGIVLYLYK
ncbi:syntaxin-71 [Phtheirospermum japonicum]|uniref:Syntaxin-71 n=1 Tax=Phtheirospermum japonicum TaxID=374723 RepID=A0A830CYB8_9LAMI|nr:syntaxin-71 [Phtheirospermum japonicum]